MSDSRPPVPRYGEYADPATVRAAGGGLTPPVPVPAASARPSRTADLVVTIVLLALGLLGTLIAVTSAPVLPQVLEQQYALYGLDGYEPPPSLPFVQWTLALSHVVLFLAALVIAVPRLRRRQVAFWAPLTAGVLAALVFWGALTALLASDQRLMEAVAGI